MRVASTPNLSNISIGSTPLLRDFDIGLPSLPSTVPVTTTSSKAFLPVNLRVSIIIRETHRKIMSRPVTRTSVGRKVSRSTGPQPPSAATLAGEGACVPVGSPVHPNVENAHNPLE